MTHAPTFQGTRRQTLRRLTAFVVLMLYLLSGALHNLCDLDVAGGTRDAVVSLVSSHEPGQPSDEGIVSAHHCHGCFSVAVPAPLTVAALIEPVRTPMLVSNAQHDGRTTGIDPPPPKHLV